MSNPNRQALPLTQVFRTFHVSQISRLASLNLEESAGCDGRSAIGQL